MLLEELRAAEVEQKRALAAAKQAHGTLDYTQKNSLDLRATKKVREGELVQEMTRSLQGLDVDEQDSVNSVNVPPLVPIIVDSLVEYHANIGCYQCYLFLDSHKRDSYKQTEIFDVAQLCVRVEFPYVELMYRGSNDEESVKALWRTEIERNVNVAQCSVENKEDHWYLRLPIQSSDKQPLGGFSSFTQVSSVELRPQSYTSVCCRGCSAQLLNGKGHVKIEKVLPLPSANWMDMFDFWGAGIGAFEHIPRDDIHAQLHRVLVGESYVLLHASDLVHKAVSIDCEDEVAVAPGDDAKEEHEWVPLSCVACSKLVGLRSVEQPETVRLHKHRISAYQLLEANAKDNHVEEDQKRENIFGNYTIDSILSAKLLEMADSDGIFRFVLTSSGDQRDYNLLSGRQGSTADTSSTELQLQLLSWETMIKQQDTKRFRRVMKVLYSPRQPTTAIPGLLPWHKVSLPQTMYLAISKRLQVSSKLLPSSLRAFNRMNVGYLFAWP
ncbi:unnamed protein product [Peronospora destructor]|uniref:Uncharacterized protein n=1 Tax=Peronospora destructor TaxID=86335 RepID=A0AAV0V992_9STRA|nr:unnamed protein product [Peronospora destructor]